MQTIELITEDAAPIERCFLLFTSIDLHIATTSQTDERAIAGVTSGLIKPGESVTWRGRHFGLMLTHESRITAYEAPHYFRDEIVQGHFSFFAHDHYFTATRSRSVVRYVLQFAAPFGVLRILAERLVLRQYLHGFLAKRNLVIKRVAESDEWQQYLLNQPD